MYEGFKNFIFYDFDDSEIATSDDATTEAPITVIASSGNALLIEEINSGVSAINYSLGTITLICILLVLLRFHGILKNAFRNNGKDID